MAMLLKNARVIDPQIELDCVCDVLVEDGKIAQVGEGIAAEGAEVKDLTGKVLVPGLVDMHVHLREPGYEFKEDIASGTRAAAHGGFTGVCSMPNTDPVADDGAVIEYVKSRAAEVGKCRVYPSGAITHGLKGEIIAEMGDMVAHGAVAFTDDGKGVQDREMMRAAMLEAKHLGKLIVAHCEDNSLLRGGYIHDGAYAKAHGHRGICSESEWRPIQRDLELVRETGCGYHICHISTKESVALIRKAKAEGLNVTCETGPHYLLLDDSMLEEDGRFKMNPPIRDKTDREALLEGLADGTIDMIATDHAPHSPEEKSRGLEKSAMGIVGLETAFSLVYTGLVKTGIISMNRLMELLHDNPCRRFGIPQNTGFTVFDLNSTYQIDPADFLSAGKATPFTGWNVEGRCLLTSTGETIAWYDADRLPKGETL